MTNDKAIIKQISDSSKDRIDFWVKFINSKKINSLVEVGVYKGDLAKVLLKECATIAQYFMIDPWRNLEAWDKPANTNDNQFEQFLNETLEQTNFAKDKRIVLRGKTTEVIDKISDDSLDFAYIDGDHTLKGITIDLVNIWPKIKLGGFLCGDDLTPSIWQHSMKYEPSVVFPFVVYFAEAHNCPIYLLPNNQFIIGKTKLGFEICDLTGLYKDTTILKQLSIKQYFKVMLKTLLSVNKTYKSS